MTTPSEQTRIDWSTGKIGYDIRFLLGAVCVLLAMIWVTLLSISIILANHPLS